MTSLKFQHRQQRSKPDRQSPGDDLHKQVKHHLNHINKLVPPWSWPSSAPALPHSLQDSGKSRADLWQYAANVALEVGLDMCFLNLS